MVEHYFSEKPSTEFSKKLVTAVLLGVEFKFFTAKSVFSKLRVDKASKLLIENVEVKQGWNVLDLGCGYGVIGIALAKVYNCKVWMTDINKRAVTLAKINAKLNNVKVKILQGWLYQPVKHLKFDAIVVNPPISAGRSLCFEIIEKAPEHLKNQGSLQLVARHKKGGAMLEKKMLEVFGNVQVVAKKSGFRVYKSYALGP